MNKKKAFIFVAALFVCFPFYCGCAVMGETQPGLAVDTDELAVRIDNVYKNRFDDIIVKGWVSRPATIFVKDSEALAVEDNYFSIETHWDVGEPVVITAQDTEGNTKEIEFWPDREPPDKPENLRAIHVTSNSVEFEWNENREPDIKGYKVYYGLKGGGVREAPDIATDNKYEIIGLKNFVRGGNRTFQFYLRAVDMMDNESHNTSDILEVTIPE